MNNRPKPNTFNKKPVSRFWACLFAPSIFALIWTLKIKKTRKWLILIICTIVLSNVVINMNGEIIYDEYYKKSMNQELMYFEDHPTPDLTMFIIIGFISPIPMIIFMFKWTTSYNLATCGYKSKGEWKKSRLKDNF